MHPAPGELLHCSEDPTITRFVPLVAPTARVDTPYVWAVGDRRCPDYWFPRQCPRILIWFHGGSTDSDVERIVGPAGATRVHVIEYAWLQHMRTVRLYAYRLPAGPFRLFTEPEPEQRTGRSEPNAYVAESSVEPLGSPVPVGDLFGCPQPADGRDRLRLARLTASSGRSPAK